MQVSIAQIQRMVHCWGHWAALRHCCKHGVPFDAAYYAVFRKRPTR